MVDKNNAAEVHAPAMPYLPRLSKAAGQTQILGGRWVAVNAANEAVYPGAGAKVGLCLVLEGTHVHVGDNTEYDGSADSTNAVELPANAAGGVGVVIGSAGMEVTVSHAGVDPAETYTNGMLLEVDAYGRLIPIDAGTAVARVISVATDANGVTQLTFVTV